MQNQDLRKYVHFSRFAARFVDILGLFCLCGLFFLYAPLDLLRVEPATGGDMGSHYWTFELLRNYALPEWSVKVWNPGNHAGEPRLIHYFPLPFLIMAALSLAMPLGMAFNWGTLLGIILFPLAVYRCCRALGLRFPAPLICAASTLVFVYGESFSMWGGNTLSALAGQFAHVYGLAFFLLGVGEFARELRLEKPVFFSSLAFAATVLSHGYPALGIPVAMLTLTLLYSRKSGIHRWVPMLTSGIFALGLSLWFFVPMMLNKEWNTLFTMSWMSPDILSEAFPSAFRVLLLCAGAAVVLQVLASRGSLRQRRVLKSLLRGVIPWLVLTLYFGALYFLLPKLGLIDVRALPQVCICLCLFAGICLATLVQGFGRIQSMFLAFPLVLLLVWWVDAHVEKFPTWLKWNYSGWSTKQLYPELQRLSAYLHDEDGFSKPRVLYELSALNNATGTLRVFEMLPYFARRSTLESVYLEATQFSPLAVYLQAEVSRQPSCPLAQYLCPRYDVEKVLPRLKLAGVSDLILVTDEVVAQAKQVDFLNPEVVIGPWHLFSLKAPAPMVEVLSEPLEFIGRENWKEDFYQWFVHYDSSSRVLAVDGTMSTLFKEKLLDLNSYAASGSCHPQLHVEVNDIRITTDCPGKVHVLKFNYHPAWHPVGSNEELFLVSPGYMAIIPASQDVHLHYGRFLMWNVCATLSWMTFVILCWRAGRGKLPFTKSGHA